MDFMYLNKMDWLEAFTKDALTFYAVEVTEGERVGGSEWE